MQTAGIQGARLYAPRRLRCKHAAESQRWMLAVMVTFTGLGLWLLSAVNT
jgi:hypothetical protein